MKQEKRSKGIHVCFASSFAVIQGEVVGSHVVLDTRCFVLWHDCINLLEVCYKVLIYLTKKKHIVYSLQNYNQLRIVN